MLNRVTNWAQKTIEVKNKMGIEISNVKKLDNANAVDGNVANVTGAPMGGYDNAPWGDGSNSGLYGTGIDPSSVAARNESDTTSFSHGTSASQNVKYDDGTLDGSGGPAFPSQPYSNGRASKRTTDNTSASGKGAYESGNVATGTDGDIDGAGGDAVPTTFNPDSVKRDDE